MAIETISYGITAFVYLIFFAVLLTDKHHGRNKILLLVASFTSIVWATLIAVGPFFAIHILLINFVEIAKDIVWVIYVLSMLSSAKIENVALSSRVGGAIKYLIAILSTLAIVLFGLVNVDYVNVGIGALLAIHLMMAVIGIVLIEQLFRNVPVEQRWVIKFLCLGLLGSFIYNFYLYSDAMLYQRIDPVLWQTRGFVEALLLPLIAYSVSRDPLWSPEIFISRRVVFHTTTLLASSIYLFIMGIAGYYIKEFGGSWGAVIQALLLFSTIILLAILLASRRIRAKTRVFVNKHFYPYKYDYREEWLRLIRTISLSNVNLYHESIRSITQIIESPAGMLWLNTGNGYYECIEALNMPIITEHEPTEASLPKFLSDNEFVINIDEFETRPEVYSRLGSLELPAWADSQHIWLIVPLLHIDKLIGYIALEHSEVHRNNFNWEDSDLLKTAARQVASYIAQQKMTSALEEAKQFDSFNKISTYIVHDMKNLVAQLSLIISNAEKHKNNPLFMEDAINTIDNTVNKMNKMLNVVSSKSSSIQSNKINIIELLNELIQMREKSNILPVPTLGCESHSSYVKADKDQLLSIFGHIVQNAQDATPDDGKISIIQSLDETGKIIIKFIDNGCGMSEDFIKNYLFTPFKSTKGKGMGIGVYETREIITALSGSIDVESRLNHGTVFTVRLPAYN